MPRRAEPQYGIKYTFRFRNEKGTHFTTLLYEGVNDKGRLVFYNYTSKAYTTMPKERFSYIHRFNFVKEEPVERKITTINPNSIVDEPITNIKDDEELTSKGKELILKMRSLNKGEREKIRVVIGREVGEFIKDLEFYFRDGVVLSDKSYSRITSDLLKAGAVIGIRF